MINDEVAFSTAEKGIDQIVATGSKDRTIRLWKVHAEIFLLDIAIHCFVGGMIIIQSILPDCFIC